MAEIGLQDLDNIVKIIDTCSQRGAFRGGELVSVGTIREKIVEVVRAAAEAQNGVEIDGDTSVEEVDEVEVQTGS